MIHTAIDQSLQTLQTQTRAERKRAAREQDKKMIIYSITSEQLNAYRQEALKDARKEVIKELDKLGRGRDSTIVRKEIERVLNAIRCD